MKARSIPVLSGEHEEHTSGSNHGSESGSSGSGSNRLRQYHTSIFSIAFIAFIAPALLHAPLALCPPCFFCFPSPSLSSPVASTPPPSISLPRLAISALPHCWRPRVPAPAPNRPVPLPLCSVALTDDETFLAAGGTDGSVTVWDVAAGRGKVRHVLSHEDTVVRCAWLESALPTTASLAARAAVTGKLACACADGTVAVWDARDGRRIAYLTGHAGMIIDMALSPAGGVLMADAGDAAAAAAATATSDVVKIAAVTAGDDSVVRAFVIDPLVVMVAAPVPASSAAVAAAAPAAPAEGGAGSADASAPAVSGSA